MVIDAEPEIESLRLAGFDGHGTTRARYGGRWIEVEHGIPGETVRAEIVGRRRPRGRIVDLLEAAPDRVLPPCPYFREWSCGGCQWQHISYEGQLARKREAVEREMQGVTPLSVTAVHALSDPWRYRSTAGIALGKRAGFRRHASLAIVPIHDCSISHPLIGRLMARLNDLLDSGELPDFHGKVRLDVRLCQCQQEERIQLLVRPAKQMGPPAHLEVLVSALADIEVVEGISVLQANGALTTVSGSLFATTDVAGRPVSLAAASFFQTNLLLLPELIARIQAEAQPLQGKRVADVYGGVGIFGLFLAEQAGEVVEIESDALALEACRLTAKRWGLSNVSLLTAPAEEALGEAGRFDVVILDPPRSGLAEPVTDALLRGRPPLVLYVSCLAQSLARDLSRLSPAGYEVQHLELFDFYPQTYHVELLAVLRRITSA